jgi:hypothetical protein
MRDGRVLTQQACDLIGHEAFLPAPHSGFAGAGAAHDLGVPQLSAVNDPPARHAFAGCRSATIASSSLDLWNSLQP